jgi:O-antigen/teichoic acid export membrane protein
MIFLICGALTAVLYALGVREPDALTHHTRVTLSLGVGLCLLASLSLAVLAEPILAFIFGSTYAEHATPVLRVLIFGAFPLAVVDHYVALRRIRGETLSASRLVLLGGFLQLAMAALGARAGGLVELSLGWVLGLCVLAVCMAPLVYRAILPSTPAAPAVLDQAA